MSRHPHWVGTWTASPAPSEAGYGLNNHTIRMNPRVSLGGDTIRVRVSNAYGTRPLAVGGGTVGLRAKGPGVVPGSLRTLTFNGAEGAAVAAGAVLVSDPVKLDMPALADLAVAKLAPIAAETRRLVADPATVDAFMADGAARAGVIAEKTMGEVRRVVGFVR